MALFGFGKKKNQPSPVQNYDPKPEPKAEDRPSGLGALKYVNGQWIYDSTAAPEKSFATVYSSNVRSETVDAFLARSPEAKLFKLTGKPEDLAFYEVGNRCHVEEDDEDDEKYNVTVGDMIIGRLPASAVSYAEKIGSLPEMLNVIIADVDYDIEKDRDIISVYIS